MVLIGLLRHAQSEFNYQFEELIYAYKRKEFDKKELLEKIFVLSKSTHPDLLNSKLTSFGKNQCKGTSEIIKKCFPNVKMVILSPYRRVIQTFEETFENYPAFIDKSLKIKFFPEMREGIYCCADLASWTPNEFEDLRFKDRYDFSFLEEFDDPQFWFLVKMLPKEIKRAYKALDKGKTFEEKRKFLLEQMANPKYFSFKYESAESIYYRMQYVKKEIIKIVKENNFKDGE